VSRGRRSLTRAVVALSALGLVLATTPAGAVPKEAPPGSRIPVNTSEEKASAGTCSMYGSQNGFGMVCSDPNGGRGSRTLVSFLEGKTLAECWDEPPPENFQGEPRDEPGEYWLRTCLAGLDRKTLRRLGALELDFEIVFLPPDEQVILTPGEKVVVRYFFGSGQIPFPVVGVSPTPYPRVGEPLTFGLLGPTRTPELTTAGVTMYAEAVQLRVEPADGSPGIIVCRGPGELLAAEQIDDPARREADTVCLHTFERTSAGAGHIGMHRDRYRVKVNASWQIRYRVGDGPEQVLGTYEKSSVNQIRVTEVQTLVVS